MGLVEGPASPIGRASAGCDYLMFAARCRCGSMIRIWCPVQGWLRWWRWPPDVGWRRCWLSGFTWRGRVGRTRRRGCSRWSPGWSPGPTAFRTWVCSGTAGWLGCSARVGRRARRGTFLRSFTFGHVRQLDGVAAHLLARLAAGCPVLTGADQVAFVDLDDTVRQTYGHAKQGAGRGYTGVNGLNALLATICTPLSAPMIAATRLRKGSTNSARGAAKLLADALATASRAGVAGLVIVR